MDIKTIQSTDGGDPCTLALVERVARGGAKYLTWIIRWTHKGEPRKRAALGGRRWFTGFHSMETQSRRAVGTIRAALAA